MASDGCALRHATPELKGDREVVRVAVNQTCWALQCAAVGLKGDHDIVLAAVAQQGHALLWAAKELKGNREIVLAAVLRHGMALQFAAAELKIDPMARVLQALNPHLSGLLLSAELRLLLAYIYACHEGVGKFLPLELIELIGRQCTIGTVVHGLVYQQTSDIWHQTAPAYHVFSQILCTDRRSPEMLLPSASTMT